MEFGVYLRIREFRNRATQGLGSLSRMKVVGPTSRYVTTSKARLLRLMLRSNRILAPCACTQGGGDHCRGGPGAA